jgi:hypothetical protein
MKRYKVALEYSENYLETERPQPLSDKHIESLIADVLSGKTSRDISDQVYDNFKTETSEWLQSSTLNHLTGFDAFDRIDIINGCTQFIDNLYMQGPIQTLRGDYRYHERLNLSYIKDTGSLIPNIPLLIAMPFPQIGAPHHDMEEILNECLIKRIPVHIDGAWVSCCRDINFDLNHQAIESVGISLSKGLGLGWNRVGLRWCKNSKSDSITIMNDFHMNLRATVIIGLHFVRNLPPDYLWNKYGDHYYQICSDFKLTPTKSIYLALKQGNPVGLSPLIRYLTEHGN